MWPRLIYKVMKLDNYFEVSDKKLPASQNQGFQKLCSPLSCCVFFCFVDDLLLSVNVHLIFAAKVFKTCSLYSISSVINSSLFGIVLDWTLTTVYGDTGLVDWNIVVKQGA